MKNARSIRVTCHHRTEGPLSSTLSFNLDDCQLLARLIDWLMMFVSPLSNIPLLNSAAIVAFLYLGCPDRARLVVPTRPLCPGRISAAGFGCVHPRYRNAKIAAGLRRTMLARGEPNVTIIIINKHQSTTSTTTNRSIEPAAGRHQYCRTVQRTKTRSYRTGVLNHPQFSWQSTVLGFC